MALGITEEHLELADAIGSWAHRHCPPELVREAAGSADAGTARYLESLAPSLSEQGVLSLHVPEEDGGQGYGLPELAVALEELGQAMVPGPFLPTVLASAALVAAGHGGKLLAGLADGGRSGAVCLAAGMSAAPAADGGLVLSGQAGLVLGGSTAELIVLPAAVADGESWAVVDAAALQVSSVDGLDLTRQLATISADSVIVPADRLLPGLDRATVSSLAAILFGAEACGIASWAVQTAAEYAKIRLQFGRPIGQFQAVKHRCARMLTAAEQAAAAVWDAARARQGSGVSGPERELAAAVAGAIAVDAAVSCVSDCIQVLGGIGYTWEHDAHLYYRRALSLRALLGPARHWHEQVARLAMAGVSRPVKVEVGETGPGLRDQIRADLAEIASLQGNERVARLAAGGWVTPHLPRPWGRAAGPLEQVVIDEEMRAAGLRAPALIIGAWVVPALVQYGTAEQQQRFLPATLRGETTWCQLFSEPGAGSDLAGLSTRAERAEGGWKITGQKIWTSLARQADWAICIARTNPAEPRHDGISYFLLDMHAPGVEVRPLREITGDSFFNQVFLDGVFVPDDCLVGDVDGGWKIARTTLANERVSLSRSWTFGSGVGELLQVARAVPDVQLAGVGELVAAGHAIDMLGLRVTLKQLSGTEPGATGSVRKLLGMQHAQQVAELCWQLAGESGALAASGGQPVTGDGHPDGRQWARQVLQTRALTIGGGTTDIQLNVIAERMLGLPRDPDPPAA
ncbi:MAG TPA: acyl-CoA dehydrogenase [Streptosporangiaceae bacterium]|jgi:alkylation response protein AidB-like acyl-CoA dehydrogenase